MDGPAADALVGPLLMADFAGPTPPAELHRLITERGLGGVVLFAKNIDTTTQTAALCADLRAAARAAARPPLLIAVDQEGGPVERLPLGVPGAMALGAAGDPALAERAGRIAGRALAAVGANMDFAPVLDVNTNPDNPIIGIRSFGEDPARVAALGLAFAAGLAAEGVAATGKHFPGHGDVAVDSHLDLPVVAHGMDRLAAVELRPFREAVQGGLPAIMTAHVAFTAVETGPATLSPALLDGILRRQWGFDGVIVTDSLAMAPIRDDIGVGPAAVQALQAGADVLLALGGPDVLEDVFAAVAAALAGGVLRPERLAQSLRRLQRLRKRLGPSRPAAEGDRGPAAAPQEIREIAERAVTVVRRAPDVVPLRAGDRVRVVSLSGGGEAAALGEGLRSAGRAVEEVALAPSDPAAAALTPHGAVVVVTHSRGRPAEWVVEIVRRAHGALGDRLIVLASGTPYDLASLPPVATYLASYGSQSALLQAAARILTGAIPPRGRLPVGIPGRHPAGHGLVW